MITHNDENVVNEPVIPASWFTGVASPAYANIVLQQTVQETEPVQVITQSHRLLSMLELIPYLERLDVMPDGFEGIELGKNIPPSAHGAMGYAAVSSLNMRQVLITIGRYAAIRNRFFHYELRDNNKGLELVLRPALELGKYERLIQQSTLYTFLALLRSAGGRHVLEKLALSVPWNSNGLDQLVPFGFQLNVEYSQVHPAIQLDPDICEVPCITADEGLYAIACRTCEEELSVLSGSMAARVRKNLDDGLGGWRELGEVADIMAVSRRTLIRRLKDEHTSFRDLLDRTRCDLACFYLANSNLSVGQIALKTGYQDSSNFSRTFRRWKNLSPLQYRSAMKAA
jgi:AraC-like DNA-binding protein